MVNNYILIYINILFKPREISYEAISFVDLYIT